MAITSYELLGSRSGSIPLHGSATQSLNCTTDLLPDPRSLLKHRHGIRDFISHSPLILASAVTGVMLSMASFAFTYWLAHQIFVCPSWAVGCKLEKSAVFMYRHLGQVQGFVSTIYGIGIGLIAYPTYQLAETTLWPMLVQKAMTLQDIERFLSTSRGSIVSSPLALWTLRRFQHFAVVFTVALMAGEYSFRAIRLQ
jgi:hypothetical protein